MSGKHEINCSECDKKAVWVIIDEIPFEVLFNPFCEEHFQELKEMKGEMNLDFEYIEDLDLFEVFRIANKKWNYMKKKYYNLLKLYAELKRTVEVTEK